MKGFHESSIISLIDGVKKPIKDVKVGDILANGTQVRGVANILNTFKTEQYGQGIECTRECHIRNGVDSAIPFIYLYTIKMLNRIRIKHIYGIF